MPGLDRDATQAPGGDASPSADPTGGIAPGGTGGKPTSSPPIRRSLRSLTSRFRPDQHDAYLRHLEDAVADSRNLNIALTGRYGTGKSSVLDAFEDRHRDRT